MIDISHLRPGDTIEYKRRGVRGTYYCRVVAVAVQSRRQYRLKVLAHSWTGTQSPLVGTHITVSGRGIRRIHAEDPGTSA